MGKFHRERTAAMGRMHSKGKGIARRSLPYKRTPPSWVKVSASDTVKEICNMAKKGYPPSQIGVVLRDSHGIPQVKMIAGNKIVRILRAQGLAPSLPEDLYCLIKKAVAVRKHLEKNRKDKDSKSALSSSRPVSTALLVTTASPRCCHLTSSTSRPMLLLLSC